MPSSQIIEVVFLLLLGVALLSLLNKRLASSLPIVMTLGGLGLSSIPGIPAFTLSPDVVFLFFLPPLLYTAGADTSWRDFRTSLRAIIVMATALVVATTIAIASIVMYFIPNITWPIALLLGAIIAPPDAVAASSIARRLNLPKRIVTILEGESLMNDATALVLYKITLAIIVAGSSFDWDQASLDFIWIGAGGTAFGLLIGYIVVRIRRMIDDPNIEVIFSLLTPFASYLPAEHLGLSGVLSVVTTGLFVGWHLPHITSSRSRLVSAIVWGVFIFILNNMIFLLIGLQWTTIFNSITNYTLKDLFFYSSMIAISMIAIRILWVLPGVFLPYLLFPGIRRNEARPPASWVAFVGWAGMRGVVSLAAAMAIPEYTNAGKPFPMRDMVIFLTFSIIIFTLVVQGITLGKVARLLNIVQDNSDTEEERLAREKALTTALAKLAHYRENAIYPLSAIDALESEYLLRLEALNQVDQSGNDPINLSQHHDLHRKLIDLQRKTVLELRYKHKIGDSVMNRLVRELDLEELHHQRMAT